MTTPLITNKPEFMNNATDFFHTIFAPALENGYGDIEIRIFPKGGYAQNLFFSSESSAAEKAYELCNQGIDVYFGTNPRVDKGGKKDNVKYLCAFHADLDYGTDGHKKQSRYADYESALTAIHQFPLQPTILVHTGGGFHCYWVLANPLKVSDYGLETLEGINKALSVALGADSTHDIGHVFRVPGTYNLKNPERPRLAEALLNSGRKYSLEDFSDFKVQLIGTKEGPKTASVVAKTPMTVPATFHLPVENLPVSEKVKNLILHGNDGSYFSRSEADMAVITALVNRGVSEEAIKGIFLTQPIGEKYRSHPSPSTYLSHSIQKAKERSNLTEEEMTDPLFISGSIRKGEKNSYSLNVVRFQEHMVRKYKIKILDQEKAFFKYNGKSYEQVTVESLNNLCQRELGKYRHLFKNSTLSELIHYAIGDTLIPSDKARNDQVNYLNLQNGLYELGKGKLVDHTPDIFTTNLLPYDYDPNATCPRFIQFLNEIFLNDQEKINFIQEAVGYAFHQSLPTPAIFFLLGEGSNGKSVFINTITKLVGEKNACNISFNKLSDEYYILELFQKMINISGETPLSKQINTDLIKAVVAGDWVTGREPYKQPMKFRPYAKHYLAMNKAPNITDTSHGMWRRIMPIDFPRVISEEEMDRELEMKLSHELSGIFNWAIKGYKRLKDRGFKFQEPDSVTYSKQSYREETDSIRAFTRAFLVKTNDSNDLVLFGEIYDAYVSFCQKDVKVESEKKKDFKKRLTGMGYDIRRSTKNGNQFFLFKVRLSDLDLEE